MADRRTFSVSLVTPDGAAFEGDAEMIIVPGAAGEIGVLARHAPLIATLKAGSTRIHPGGGEVLTFDYTLNGRIYVEGRHVAYLHRVFVDKVDA